MTTSDRFDRTLASWLDDGPTEPPGEVLEGVLSSVPTVHRRSAMRIWWSQPVVARAGVGAVALVVFAVGVSLAVSAQPRSSVGGPGVSAAPAGATQLSTMPPMSTWVPFRSAVNAYSVSLPPDWAAVEATAIWPHGNETPEDAPWLDRAVSADGRLEFFGRVTTLPAPIAIDDWVREYEALTKSCGRGDWTPIEDVVDGSWVIREWCGRVVALGLVDGSRGIVLSLRPTSIQATLTQVREDERLLAAIAGTFIAD
jgi:hypothetical protein